MAGEFKFPSVIHFEGIPWHLVYAPDCETTIMPNLAEAQLLSVTCDPVVVAGRAKPIYLTILDILYPARRDPSGRLIAERRMKGFRTYDYQPRDPNIINPNDCVYYVAESFGRGASVAQRFFDAVIGHHQAQVQQQAQVDSSWCKSFAGVANESGSVVSTDSTERGISDGTIQQE